MSMYIHTPLYKLYNCIMLMYTSSADRSFQWSQLKTKVLCSATTAFNPRNITSNGSDCPLVAQWKRVNSGRRQPESLTVATNMNQLQMPCWYLPVIFRIFCVNTLGSKPSCSFHHVPIRMSLIFTLYSCDKAHHHEGATTLYPALNIQACFSEWT